MKILILNWRDINNPSSGGAEILTHEIAKRWVFEGHTVTIFTSNFSGSLQKEIVDGVTIIRRGNSDIRYFFTSVHFFAFLYYFKEARGNFDVVIDEIHGVPFFTPLYVKEKKIVLICEVAQGLWVKMFGTFFGLLGWVMEKLYLRTIYNSMRFVTISESTKKDLLKNAIQEKKIAVLPMGISVSRSKSSYKKEKKITLIFIGRLTPAKGVEDSIRALREIIKIGIDTQLWIVGRGEDTYIEQLKILCERLKLVNRVNFFGFVSQAKKFELLQKAHLLIHPSIREGFGLTIPEAGYVGTPVIAYNSPGLRDIVKNGKNGVLLKSNSPESIAEEAINLLKDPTFYKTLSKGAREEAKKYSWDNTAKVMFDCFKKL